jgi:hypothetical protein
MKLRMFVAAAVAALVMLPAASALAADQDVDVQVVPSDTLAVWVQEGIGFQIEVGQVQSQPFGMEVTNTTDAGWVVSVDGTDLQSYEWENCDPWGCSNRILTGNTIDRSNVVVTGGDNFGDDPGTDPTITTGSGALGPVTIMTGTASAYGRFGFGPPYEPTVQLTLPAGTAIDQYFTTLTYTITAP